MSDLCKTQGERLIISSGIDPANTTISRVGNTQAMIKIEKSWNLIEEGNYKINFAIKPKDKEYLNIKEFCISIDDEKIKRILESNAKKQR